MIFNDDDLNQIIGECARFTLNEPNTQGKIPDDIVKFGKMCVEYGYSKAENPFPEFNTNKHVMKMCPFCGGMPDMAQTPNDKWLVKCDKCHGCGDYFKEKHKAIEVWNNRTETPIDKKDRRRRIFEQVFIGHFNKAGLLETQTGIMCDYNLIPNLCGVAEKIISAADEFAEKESEK